MADLTELPQRTFFARALERIAIAFQARRPTATALELIDRAHRQTTSAVVDLAEAVRGMAPSSQSAASWQNTSMIGFPVVGGALARLPLYTQTEELKSEPALHRSACEMPASPRLCQDRLDALLPKPRATTPILGLPFLSVAPEILVVDAPVAEIVELTTTRDLIAPVGYRARPLAAQLRATAQLNRPVARTVAASKPVRAKARFMPKAMKLSPKRSAPRHVGLIVRATGTRASEALPARTVIDTPQRSPVAVVAATPRQIDFSIPAIRGALQLERAGRNEIISLPMAA